MQYGFQTHFIFMFLGLKLIQLLDCIDRIIHDILVLRLLTLLENRISTVPIRPF